MKIVDQYLLKKIPFQEIKYSNIYLKQYLKQFFAVKLIKIIQQ
jgi:hypothetical protein